MNGYSGMSCVNIPITWTDPDMHEELFSAIMVGTCFVDIPEQA